MIAKIKTKKMMMKKEEKEENEEWKKDKDEEPKINVLYLVEDIAVSQDTFYYSIHSFIHIHSGNLVKLNLLV